MQGGGVLITNNTLYSIICSRKSTDIYMYMCKNHVINYICTYSWPTLWSPTTTVIHMPLVVRQWPTYIRFVGMTTYHVDVIHVHVNIRAMMPSHNIFTIVSFCQVIKFLTGNNTCSFTVTSGLSFAVGLAIYLSRVLGGGGFAVSNIKRLQTKFSAKFAKNYTCTCTLLCM